MKIPLSETGLDAGRLYQLVDDPKLRRDVENLLSYAESASDNTLVGTMMAGCADRIVKRLRVVAVEMLMECAVRNKWAEKVLGRV